jgi:hypothetical protein
MGDSISQAIADAPLSLEDKLSWHLTGNHYPPVNEQFIPICIQAIKLANEGDYDSELVYPNGLVRTVRHCIEGLHLEFFLNNEE